MGDDVENHMENEHNIPKIVEVPKIIQTIPTSKLPEKTIASLTSLESYSQQALSIFQTSLKKPKVEKLETKSQKITQTASATISTNIPVRCICIICGKNYFESSVALSEHKYKCQDCTIDHSFGLSSTVDHLIANPHGYKGTDSLNENVKHVQNENIAMTF